MDALEITERQREELHAKILEHFVRLQVSNKRGISAPGLALSEVEISCLLRLTRARGPVTS